MIGKSINLFKNNESSIFISFILNGLFIIVSLLLHPRFQTNDDISQILIYSQKLNYDKNIIYTAFSTKTFGFLISTIYRKFNFIEIYTYTLLFINFLSWLILINVILQKIKLVALSHLTFLCFIGLLFIIPSYIDLQFTVIANIACITGIIGFKFSTSKYKVFNLIFFVLGLSVRPDIFSFIIILFFVLSALQFENKHKLIKKEFKEFFIILISGLTFLFIDNFLLSNEERQFKEFNIYKASIIDYELYDNSNFYHTNIDLFANWYLADSCINNSSIDFNYKDRKFDLTDFIEYNRVITRLNHTTDHLKSTLLTIPVAVMINFTFLLLLIFARKKAFRIIISIVAVMFLIFLISLIFKLIPYRLIIPTCVFLFIYSIFNFNIDINEIIIKNNIVNNIIFTLLAIFFIRFNYERLFWNYINCKELTELNERDFLVVSSNYNFENINPFDVPNFNNKNIVVLGTYSYFNKIDYLKLKLNNQPLKFLDVKSDSFIFILQNHIYNHHNIKSKLTRTPISDRYIINEIVFDR